MGNRKSAKGIPYTYDGANRLVAVDPAVGVSRELTPGWNFVASPYLGGLVGIGETFAPLGVDADYDQLSRHNAYRNGPISGRARFARPDTAGNGTNSVLDTLAASAGMVSTGLITAGLGIQATATAYVATGPVGGTAFGFFVGGPVTLGGLGMAYMGLDLAFGGILPGGLPAMQSQHSLTSNSNAHPNSK